MKRFFFIILLSSVLFGYDYWIPYCNTIHVPGESNWHSELYVYTLWDSTHVFISGLVDTIMEKGNRLDFSGFTSCGTKIETSFPVLIKYQAKVVYPSEYEPMDFSYSLIPDEFLGREYYISSLHTPPADYEFVAFTSTVDDNGVLVDGVFRGTYDAGDCDTVHFDSDGVIHLQANGKIAVAHIGSRASKHDDFYAYSLLPTEFWGDTYLYPRQPERWSSGYLHPEDSLRVIITGLEDGTTVDVGGAMYSVDAGGRLVVNTDTGEVQITADNPIQVVKYFWIIGEDHWWSDSIRWYSTATTLIPNTMNFNHAFILKLNARGSEHGGPMHWYTITSFADDNQITIDVDFDGTDEVDTVLNYLQTLILHDTISTLPGADTVYSLLVARKPIQVIYEKRGWWDYFIESHKNISYFIPGLCGTMRAEFICPEPGVFVSCSPAQFQIGIFTPVGAELDTSRVYFTLIVSHTDGTADTTTVMEPLDNLQFFDLDTMWVVDYSDVWENGDTVELTLDSAYTTDDCLTIFH